MKSVIRVATVLLILSWSLQALAQADPNYDERMIYAAKYYKYKKMKATGLVLAIGGGVLGIVGISKLSNAPTTTTSTGQVVATGDQATTGALMFLASIPMVGAGIPLSIVGHVKSKKYGALMDKLSMGGRVTPRSVGVSLTYRL
jgi:hypothetical protein